jgi:hypothetical protein
MRGLFVPAQRSSRDAIVSRPAPRHFRNSPEAQVCYHFATQLLNMRQDRALSNDQRPTPQPNKINQIDIDDDCLGRHQANCKTVYTSSILVVASINIINSLHRLFVRPEEGARFDQQAAHQPSNRPALRKPIALTRSKQRIFSKGSRQTITRIKRGVECGASKKQSKFDCIFNDLWT